MPNNDNTAFKCPNCGEQMLYAELCSIWHFYSITDDGCVDYEMLHPKLEAFVDVDRKGIECPKCKYYVTVDIDFDDDNKIIPKKEINW